ncbi:MAG: hypothetical protein HZA46_21460 [Planctomycetales bacterium]|nr:hypothetical protein [Planctomycetales bacterium]
MNSGIAPVPALGTVSVSPDVTSGYWVVSSRRNYNQEGAWRLNPSLSYYFSPGNQSLKSADEGTFSSAINNGAPTCVVVFGSYNGWEDAFAETRPISRWLRSAAPDQRLNIVFFTWPSDGMAPFLFPAEIAVLGRRSSYQGVFLAELLAHVPQTQPLCLIGHSHGARTVSSAVHLMAGGEIENNVRLAAPASIPPACRVVLLVAAIDHHWLNPGQRYGMALPRIERMLSLRNSLDTALGLYTIRKPGATSALGGPGLTWNDRTQLGPESAKIVERDISRYTGAGHSWQDIHPHRDLAAAVSPYVFFLDDQTATTPPLTTGAPPGQRTQTMTAPRDTSGPVLLAPTNTTSPRVPAGTTSSPTTRRGMTMPARRTSPRISDW